MLNRTDRGAVAHLEMDAPDSLNALSSAMLAVLMDQFASLAQDPQIRVVVISGAGKAFCAGHDLKEITGARQAEDAGAAFYAKLFGECGDMMQAIKALPQVVIAQVHGIATAAGCQLVAGCDLAVADEDTRFGVNGVNIGLFCSTPMVAVSRNLPRKKVFEMLVTGDFIDAHRACELGLVNRVVPPQSLATETAALADQVAGKLGAAVRLGKRAFYEQIEMPVDAAFAHTTKTMVENLLIRDTQEGIDAFLQKRDPAWDQ